jgi:hypothetical protein
VTEGPPRDREPPGQGWLPPEQSRDVPPAPAPRPPPAWGAPPPPTQPNSPVQPYGQVQAAPHAAAQGPGNGEAVAALVLGIVAIVLVIPFGIFLITLPIALVCGVIAIILGRTGRRKVDRGETTRNRGAAQAGLVTGVVGTALAVLSIVAFILLINLSEGFQRDFERGFEQGIEQQRQDIQS